MLYEGWPVLNPGVFVLPTEVERRIDAFLAAGDRDAVVETVFRHSELMSDEDMKAFKAAPSWLGRCGSGRILNRLAELFPKSRFVGMDLSNEAIQVGREETSAKGLKSVEFASIDHPIGTFLYTVSFLHCMTVSLAQGGEGLGAMWGEEKTREHLRLAGFQSVEKHELSHEIQNNWYVVRK